MSDGKGAYLMALAKLKISTLSADQLLELREMIDGNLADSEQDLNQQIPAAESDPDQPDDGYIEEKYIPRTLKNGTVKMYGPYKYRVRMVDGKKKRKYLGKVRK